MPCPRLGVRTRPLLSKLLGHHTPPASLKATRLFPPTPPTPSSPQAPPLFLFLFSLLFTKET